MPNVSIIILNRNGPEAALQCISSLAGLDYPDYEVLIVDTRKTDGSGDAVREWFPQVRLVESHEDIGVAAARNRGIRDALDRDAGFVLLLDSDLVAGDPSFLRPLVEFYESTPDAGAVGPVILSRGSSAGVSGLEGGSPRKVEWVPGSAMLLGRKFLSEVGMFDPDYLSSYDDADLCFRGAAASYSNYVVPASLLTLKRSAGESAAEVSKTMPPKAYRSAFDAVMFARKNLRGRRKAAFLLAQYTVRLAAAALKPAGRRAAGEHLRGLRDATMFSLKDGAYPVDLNIIKHEVRYGVYRRLFSWLERHGFHLTPVNFYFPVPDTRSIPQSVWDEPSQLAGLDLREQAQLDLLNEFAAGYKEEYESFPRHRTPVPYRFYLRNNFFGAVDAEMLYCMIRRFKPRKMIEIGSGNSTMLAAEAALKNRAETGLDCELIAIEPNPNPLLREGFPGLSRLEVTRLEEMPLDEFASLEENDILFIDSSHVLRIGGDVQYEYLEILPRLKPGVIIHVHDIMLPADYGRRWVLEQCRFYTEQYVLQAFLTLNDSFEVMLAGAFLAASHPDKLKDTFDSFDPGATPGSFWMRRVK